MPTIAKLTKKIVENDALIKEAMIKRIVSYQSLAEYIQPKVEKELGKNVKTSAIMMALRRYGNKLKKIDPNQLGKYFEEISVKTDMSYIILEESQNSLDKINKYRENINFSKGEIYHIIQNGYEIGLITNDNILEKILELLGNVKIKKIFSNLILFSLKYSEEYMNSPETINNIFWELTRENIKLNIWFNSTSEFSFLVSEKDFIPSYNTLLKLKTTVQTLEAGNKKVIYSEMILPSIKMKEKERDLSLSTEIKEKKKKLPIGLKKRRSFVLDERDKAVKLFSNLGMPKNLAKTLAFISQVDECRPADIEYGANLRQPEVSVAMQELKKKGWIAKRDIKKEGKGRPVHVYKLTSSLENVIKGYEQEKLQQIKDTKEELNMLKKFLKEYEISTDTNDKSK